LSLENPESAEAKCRNRQQASPHRRGGKTTGGGTNEDQVHTASRNGGRWFDGIGKRQTGEMRWSQEHAHQTKEIQKWHMKGRIEHIFAKDASISAGKETR